MLCHPLLSAVAVCAALFPAVASPAAGPPAGPGLNAEQIVEKNVAARGGLAVWRKVDAIQYTGKLEAGGEKNVELPVVITAKRPRMTRVELTYGGKTSLQVYDGTNGWKFRPYARNDVESFNSQELRKASQDFELDGPLIDHQAKGIAIALESQEHVADHDTYRLKLTMKDGTVRHIWLDAKTFLEVKMDGVDRVMNGHPKPVEIYLSDYRKVEGLMIPFANETLVVGWDSGYKIPGHKLTVEQVTVNPKLDTALFGKPKAVLAASSPTPQVAGAKAR